MISIIVVVVVLFCICGIPFWGVAGWASQPASQPASQARQTGGSPFSPLWGGRGGGNLGSIFGWKQVWGGLFRDPPRTSLDSDPPMSSDLVHAGSLKDSLK